MPFFHACQFANHNEPVAKAPSGNPADQIIACTATKNKFFPSQIVVSVQQLIKNQ